MVGLEDTLAGHNLATSSRESIKDETAHAALGPRTRHWKRPQRDPCQLGFSERRIFSPVRLHRAESLAQRFLHPQAIGWACGSMRWTDSKEVRRYVKANTDSLEPAQRAGLKKWRPG
jgi:hypothetical protein